jgi:SOS-response transcriptional repressor LexA
MSKIAKGRVGVTGRMLECYNAIAEHIARTETSPSYDYLKNVLGLRSKSGITRLVYELRERGWITFVEGRGRSLALTQQMAGHKLPDKVEAALRAYCIANNEPDPSAVVADAVAIFLDQSDIVADAA